MGGGVGVIQGHFLGRGAGMTPVVGEADTTQVEYSEKSKIAFPALCTENVDWGPAVGKCR